MSVMSAAGARHAAGASPEIAPRLLQIARSEASHDDAVTAGSPWGAGGTTSAQPRVPGGSAGALRVTHVRMVREVRVRTLRARGSRPRSAPQLRAAARPGMATQPPAAARTRAAAQAMVSGYGGTAGQAPVATDSPMTGQARTASAARTASQAHTARRARTFSQVRARTFSQVRVASQAPVAARPGAVRLTRRGRRVVAGLVIGVVIVAATLLWMTLAGGVQASGHGPVAGSPYRGMTQVVVQPGQTLWSIATSAEPSANPWAVVQQIINVNALSSAKVQAGQLLWVPGR